MVVHAGWTISRGLTALGEPDWGKLVRDAQRLPECGSLLGLNLGFELVEDVLRNRRLVRPGLEVADVLVDLVLELSYVSNVPAALGLAFHVVGHRLVVVVVDEEAVLLLPILFAGLLLLEVYLLRSLLGKILSLQRVL